MKSAQHLWQLVVKGKIPVLYLYVVQDRRFHRKESASNVVPLRKFLKTKRHVRHQHVVKGRRSLLKESAKIASLTLFSKKIKSLVQNQQLVWRLIISKKMEAVKIVQLIQNPLMIRSHVLQRSVLKDNS